VRKHVLEPAAWEFAAAAAGHDKVAGLVAVVSTGAPVSSSGRGVGRHSEEGKNLVL
jgi:hypothetical protein